MHTTKPQIWLFWRVFGDFAHSGGRIWAIVLHGLMRLIAIVLHGLMRFIELKILVPHMPTQVERLRRAHQTTSNLAILAILRALEGVFGRIFGTI